MKTNLTIPGNISKTTPLRFLGSSIYTKKRRVRGRNEPKETNTSHTHTPPTHNNTHNNTPVKSSKFVS